MNNTVNRLWVVTPEGCPNGMAGTARIMSHCCGFAEKNVDVKIIVFRSAETVENANKSQWVNSRLEIKYVTSPLISPVFFLRCWNRLRGTWNMLLLLAFSGNAPQVLFLYGTPRGISYLLKGICLCRRIIMIQERNEHPCLGQNAFQRFKTSLYYRCAFSPFDGMIVMTKLIHAWFRERKWPENHLVHIPMSVNMERFAAAPPSPENNPYLFYAGVISKKKDGVDLLISAFARVAQDFPRYRLILGGTGNDLEEMKTLGEKYHLSERILFTGYIPSEKIPAYVCNAEMLILARPRSQQAEAGFPTKLGEYLASGRPVIVSSVGEIPDYLKDRDSAYLVEPGDADSLEKAIRDILNHPDDAGKIGERGRETAKISFNAKILAGNILKWLHDNYKVKK